MVLFCYSGNLTRFNKVICPWKLRPSRMQKGCAKCQVASQMRDCNWNKVSLFSGAVKMVIMELQGVKLGSASVIPSDVEGIMNSTKKN